MARINRSDIIQKAVNDLGISTANDKVPTETLDKIQLTYDLTRQFSNFITSTSSASTGTLTLTLPTLQVGQEFYLTALNFGIVKDSSCDVGSGRMGVSVTPDAQGIALNIAGIPILTLTAQSENLFIPLSYPIKLKGASTITSSNTFTLGNCARQLAAIGFITSSA